jgi:hypothetical protein
LAAAVVLARADTTTEDRPRPWPVPPGPPADPHP